MIPSLGTIKSFQLLINSIIRYSALFGDDRLQPHCIRKPDLAICSVSSSRLHKARSGALGAWDGACRSQSGSKKRGVADPLATLDKVAKAGAKRRRDAGESLSEIGRLFGVNYQTMGRL